MACDARLLDEDTDAGHTYLDQIPSRDRPKPLTLDRILRAQSDLYLLARPTAVGEAVGWFDVELFGTEDFGLWVKILERGLRGHSQSRAAGGVPAPRGHGLLEHRAAGRRTTVARMSSRWPEAR